MIASRGNALGCLGRRGPVDVVLDHPPLQRVTSDSQQLRGIDDAARAIEGLLAEESLGFAEVEVFQENRHDPEDM